MLRILFTTLKHPEPVSNALSSQSQQTCHAHWQIRVSKSVFEKTSARGRTRVGITRTTFNLCKVQTMMMETMMTMARQEMVEIGIEMSRWMILGHRRDQGQMQASIPLHHELHLHLLLRLVLSLARHGVASTQAWPLLPLPLVLGVPIGPISHSTVGRV